MTYWRLGYDSCKCVYIRMKWKWSCGVSHASWSSGCKGCSVSDSVRGRRVKLLSYYRLKLRLCGDRLSWPPFRGPPHILSHRGLCKWAYCFTTCSLLINKLLTLTMNGNDIFTNTFFISGAQVLEQIVSRLVVWSSLCLEWCKTIDQIKYAGTSVMLTPSQEQTTRQICYLDLRCDVYLHRVQTFD